MGEVEIFFLLLKHKDRNGKEYRYEVGQLSENGLLGRVKEIKYINAVNSLPRCFSVVSDMKGSNLLMIPYDNVLLFQYRAVVK